MSRAIARGRMVPQSLSTDPRMGRISLKAALLFPLMWINCDDQGRRSGDPDEIKYAVCPNIEHISKADIPELLKELDTQELIKVYSTSKTKATQMLDWWDVQKLQWAYPSQYPPPEGWQDRLRYHASPTQLVTENWPPKSKSLGKELPSALGSALRADRESNKEITEKEERRRRGRGNLPSTLGSKPTPSPTTLSTEIKILDRLTSCFKKEWGKVLAYRPHEVIPREPNAREAAQLRDLAKELSATDFPLDHIDQAFREAAGQPNKMHISYARAILFDWLGLERGPP